MKSQLFHSIVLAASLCSYGQEAGQAAVPPPPPSAAGVQPAQTNPKDLLDDAFDRYAAERGFSYGEKTAAGSIYYKGSSAVEQSPESATFVKSRTFAYERAYIDAVAEYVKDFFGRELVENCVETFGNQSTNAETPPTMTPADLGRKIELLADANLDKALEKAGVDPSKYAESPVAEKRTLLKDAIVKRTINKALHSSSGCLPVKTFESRGEGRYYIGVVIRVGADCTALSNAFRTKLPPALQKDSGLTVKEALPQDPAEMVQTFGVRLYFDESGRPALLSFAQFGSSYMGKSARLADRAEDQAKHQARALADSGLTAFINSFIDMTEESELSEDISSSRIFREDGSATPEEISEVIDIYRRKISQKGSDTMKGRTTVYERVVKHPEGHRIAVCVRKWSFGQVEAVNEVLNQGVRKAPVRETKKVYDSGVRSSRTYDF